MTQKFVAVGAAVEPVAVLDHRDVVLIERCHTGRHRRCRAVDQLSDHPGVRRIGAVGDPHDSDLGALSTKRSGKRCAEGRQTARGRGEGTEHADADSPGKWPPRSRSKAATQRWAQRSRQSRQTMVPARTGMSGCSARSAENQLTHPGPAGFPITPTLHPGLCRDATRMAYAACAAGPDGRCGE